MFDAHTLAHTQWVPKRDPRKQEMTAEGRSRSRERTDTTRPLSREEQRAQHPVQEQEKTKHN